MGKLEILLCAFKVCVCVCDRDREILLVRIAAVFVVDFQKNTGK